MMLLDDFVVNKLRSDLFAGHRPGQINEDIPTIPCLRSRVHCLMLGMQGSAVNIQAYLDKNACISKIVNGLRKKDST